ncbi:MAG: WG repeat-containing protein [candidate division WOR-3 bacterium]
MGEKLIPFPRGSKWGYVDKEGKVVINPQFDYAYPFSEGLAGVNIGGRQFGHPGGILIKGRDKLGINLPFFDFPRGIYREGGILFGKWGYINKEGKFVINPQFDYAYPFSEGLAVVQDGGLWGHINKEGQNFKIKFD